VREYETVFIVDPGCSESEVNQEVDTVTEIITAGNGTVGEKQIWGKRRLAYEIGRKKEGTYVFVRFQAGPAVLAELNRRFKLNELILRHLIVVSQGFEEPQSSGRGEGEERAYEGEGNLES